MDIPKTILELRKELKRRGDNVKIAKLASRGGGPRFIAHDVSLAITRKRAHENLVLAISDYYSKKHGVNMAVRNITNKVEATA